MVRGIITLVAFSAVIWSTSLAQASHAKNAVAFDLDRSMASLSVTSHRSVNRQPDVVQLARHVHPRHVRRARHHYYRHPTYRHHLPHPSVRHYSPHRCYAPVPRRAYYPARAGGVGVYGPNVSLWVGF